MAHEVWLLEIQNQRDWLCYIEVFDHNLPSSYSSPKSGLPVYNHTICINRGANVRIFVFPQQRCFVIVTVSNVTVHIFSFSTFCHGKLHTSPSWTALFVIVYSSAIASGTWPLFGYLLQAFTWTRVCFLPDLSAVSLLPIRIHITNKYWHENNLHLTFQCMSRKGRLTSGHI